MTESPPGFSVGKKSPSGVAAEGEEALAPQVEFGKCPPPSDRQRPAHFVRLSILGAEIGLLFSDDHETGSGLVSLLGDGDPYLAMGANVGLSLKVEIDPETGLFVLHEGGNQDDCILITAGEERLLDHILAKLSNSFRLPGKDQAHPCWSCAGERLSPARRCIRIADARQFSGFATYLCKCSSERWTVWQGDRQTLRSPALFSSG